MNKKKSSKKESQAKATPEGAVVIPVKMDKEPVYMAEEVDTLAQARRAIKDDVKTQLQQFVGLALTAVEENLAQMIAAGLIGSFRVLLQGQMFTGDHVPDRVQLVVGTDKQVKEVAVG